MAPYIAYFYVLGFFSPSVTFVGVIHVFVTSGSLFIIITV